MEIFEGAGLPCIERLVVQENINKYAKAARDFNPIHINEDFAKKTPAGGTIAHGMLALAYVSQMMTNAFGIDWVIGGKLDIRFKTPARPASLCRIGAG